MDGISGTSFGFQVLLLMSCSLPFMFSAEVCDGKGLTCDDDVTDEEYTQPLQECTMEQGELVVYTSAPSESQMASTYHSIRQGGKWQPSNCSPKKTVAILVPYRDRRENLEFFLPNIHRFLQKQKLSYGIYLIEQADSKHFNRGTLLNVGFLQSMRDKPYDCIVLHDIDKYPEDIGNSYACAEGEARHLIAQIRYPHQNYRKIPYETYFGGVTLLSTDVFQKVNGFSNRFFGWGSEDDDLYNRLQHHSVDTSRSEADKGRYVEIYNPLGFVNPKRHEMVKEGMLWYTEDGLNSVDYTVLSVTKAKLYTNISIVINQLDPFR